MVYPEGMQNLVQSMLQYKANDRPSISEVKGYPWMTETQLPTFEEAHMFYQGRVNPTTPVQQTQEEEKNQNQPNFSVQAAKWSQETIPKFRDLPKKKGDEDREIFKLMDDINHMSPNKKLYAY